MSHFTFGHCHIPGNGRFYTKNKEQTPSEVRYYEKKKIEPILLVWLAISEDGHSEPFFAPSKGNINGNIYQQECIKCCLIPFLQQHHADGDYIFWPDLASSHYAKDTIALFDEENIHFVPKKNNPPNVPQLRPIENFWGILKSKVYHGGWKVKTKNKLQLRIKKCLRECDWNVVQNTVSSIKTKLRKAADTTPRPLL